MEMTIGTDTVVMLAELLSALGVIGGVVLWLFNFVQRSRRQAEELRSIRKEQSSAAYPDLLRAAGLFEGLKGAGLQRPGYGSHEPARRASQSGCARRRGLKANPVHRLSRACRRSGGA